jgi:N-acetylglucosamine-6-sulfatase
MSSSRMRAGLRPMTAMALTVCLCLGLLPGAAWAAPAKPNIVLIVSDDEDVASHAFMPKTRALIEEQGVAFENFFVTYPLCCPSRASILRGQYAHNTQILGNELPWGGFKKFRASGLEMSTIATWLQDAGYHTAKIGKYMNRYLPREHAPAPGWDDWYIGGAKPHDGFNYTLNENGRVVFYGARPQDYVSDVLTGKANGVIRTAVEAENPFFVYILPYTPHLPAVPAPRHRGMFAEAKLPRLPSFDEADVSDKPVFIRSLTRIDEGRSAYMQDHYRKRLETLQGLDDMVESVVSTLRETGQLENTYVIYTSDNGFHLGEHRLPLGKDTVYEEDIRVPMVMRGPDVPRRGRVDALALNIDLAPTIAQIAGIEAPDFVDGRSFLPLLDDPDRPWRKSFLIERRHPEVQLVRLAKRMGLTQEAILETATFNAIRTSEVIYVEYGTGERELYDLRQDPHQLINVVEDADPVLVEALAARMLALEVCSGEECRSLEDLPILDTPRQVAAGPG